MKAPRYLVTACSIAISVAVSACSGGGGGSAEAMPPPPAAPKSGPLELLAGAAAPTGSVDGVATAARFGWITNIAADRSGNVYMVDREKEDIRKMDAAGNVTTFAGSAYGGGFQDGPAASARFSSGVTGIVADMAGNAYVADSNRIRKIASDGTVSTLAGSSNAAYADGVGASASFYLPTALAVDASGNVFVADWGNHVIRRITPDGTVTTFAGNPGVSARLDGAASTALFTHPEVMAIDGSGNLYVVEDGDPSIRKITPGGDVSTFAPQATFGAISAMAVDASGNLLVEDGNDIRRISPDGSVSTYATSLPPLLSGLTVDRMGRVLIGDGASLRSVSPGVNSTVLIAGGSGTEFGGADVDGEGSFARFQFIHSMATAPDGTTYTTSPFTGALRRVSSAGVVSTITLSPSVHALAGVAVDSAGGVIVLETGSCGSFGNCTYLLFRVSPTGQASPVPIARSSDGTDMTLPGAGPINVDPSGNIYIAGAGLRKLSPAGDLTTVVNASVYSAAIDSHGTPYWSDFQAAIWRMSANGPEIFAGAEVSGNVDGQGSSARFGGNPYIAFDSQDNLYVADANNLEIRKIGVDGQVTTIAGTPAVYGFRPGPLPGTLDPPRGISVSGSNLYVGMPYGIAVIRNRP